MCLALPTLSITTTASKPSGSVRFPLSASPLGRVFLVSLCVHRLQSNIVMPIPRQARRRILESNILFIYSLWKSFIYGDVMVNELLRFACFFKLLLQSLCDNFVLSCFQHKHRHFNAMLFFP